MLNAGERLDAHYWRQHIRGTVQFSASMQTLAEQGYDLFLEIGPDSILSNMGKRCLPAGSASWLPTLRKEQDDWSILLGSVAELYTKGALLRWGGFDGDYARQRLSLPTYPFEREYCWFEEQVDAQTSTQEPVSRVVSRTDRHPLLDEHIELVYPARVHVWESSLDKQRLPYLTDHRIQGAIALPVSVYVEMAQAATVEAFGPGNHVLTEIELKKLLLLPEKGAQKVQVVVSSDANEQVAFQVYSHSIGVPEQPRNKWTLHASGKIRHN